jgi:hypothetical protein
LSTTIWPALEDATFISAAEAEGISLGAPDEADGDAGAEEAAEDPAGVEEDVEGLPAHPPNAIARTNAPSPRLNLLFITGSFDGPAGMGRH